MIDQKLLSVIKIDLFNKKNLLINMKIGIIIIEYKHCILFFILEEYLCKQAG